LLRLHYWIAPFAGSILLVTAQAAEPVMPFVSTQAHMGVATCAGANCHGATKPPADAKVLQNEYFVWQRDDAHSNAYKLLLLPEARRIASNLGLKNAHEAPECLTCHSDYVAAARRGSKYSFSEGVGCEACHGAAEKWLEPHANGNTHAQNIAAGLYPVEDPAARARVCLHCHQGSGDKPIDHRIMGAGHPPLDRFELDSNTANQPAHFKVDKDYRERKTFEPNAKVWAMGQLVTAQFFLEGLQSQRLSGDGLFPELVFFDCNACHHAMQPPRWNAGLASPLGPGEVRLADSSLIMSGHVLAVVAPAAAAQWTQALSDLHRASRQSTGKVKEAATRMSAILAGTLPAAGNYKMTRADAVTLIDRIAASGIERDAGNFSAARQMFYAIDSLRIYLQTEHSVKSAALDKADNQMFDAIDIRILRPDKLYSPDAMRSGLRNVRAAVSGLR
jgi:hypothetical protein